MNNFLTYRAAIGVVVRRAGMLCCVLTLMSGAATAQTSRPGDAASVPGESANQDGMPPPGGCKPIGLTVSGEIVFPLECKEFIEQRKAINPAAAATNPGIPEPKSAVPEPRPVAAEVKPAITEEKPAPAPDKPAVAEDKPASMKERPETADAKSAATETKPVATETAPTTADTKPAAVETMPAVEPRPAAAELKPEDSKPAVAKPAITQEKTAAKPSDEKSPDDSQASQEVGSVPLPRRAERKPRERIASEPGCTHFRTYNAATGTYRGFDGRTRPCQ